MQFIKTGLFVLGISSTISVMAQPVSISVQSGQKFKVESTVNLNTSAEVMGQSMVTTADSKNTTVYQVKSTGSDGINLGATITNMVVNTSSMGQEMSFNSEDKGSSGPMADMLKPRLNKEKSITIDAKGNVTKQDESGDDGQLAMMGMGGGNSTTIDLFIPALVGKDLKSGDSFTDIGSAKKEKYSSRDSGTYKITAIENGVASISYTGTQVIAATVEQMGMEMQTTSNNTVKSEMQVDVKTGLVLLKASVIEMNVSVDAGGMTIPATGKTVITIKISPAD